MTAVNIASELRADGSERIRRLEAVTVESFSLDAFERQNALLEEAERGAGTLTKRIVGDMSEKHASLDAIVAVKMISLRSRSDEDRKRAYIRYLVQLWYHTQFDPEFERIFGERLRDHFERELSASGVGNRFLRAIAPNADEELGQELWALQDIERVGGLEVIDLRRDVLPETRALVRSQFDRLNRMNFKGFLGYTLYLDSYVAKHARRQLDALQALGIAEDRLSFIRNHWLADQGHAVADIRLLNELLESDGDVEEVLDNMELIHCLYSRMVEKCLEP